MGVLIGVNAHSESIFNLILTMKHSYRRGNLNRDKSTRRILFLCPDGLDEKNFVKKASFGLYQLFSKRK